MSISINIAASRINGVAPLAVFFDATATTLSGSYLDATFLWDFDNTNVDPSALYKVGSGFVIGHVFPNPGTYTVSLTVWDSAGQTATSTVQVTVSAFSGTTYYVALSGSDSNDGLSMAHPLLTANYAIGTIAYYAGPNTQILFRNGDTFYTPFNNCNGRPGPVIISNYIDPGSPSNVLPTIYSTEVDGAWQVLLIGNDWRIMNLKVRSGGDTISDPRYPGGIQTSNTTINSLIYRIVESYLGADGGPVIYGRYNAVVECDISRCDGGGYSSPAGGSVNDSNFIIGNYVHDMDHGNQHAFRLQTGSKFFFGFNNIDHAYDNFNSVTIQGNTDQIVIYKNIINGELSFQPQNLNSAAEYVHHCVADSNLLIGRTEAGYERQQALAVVAKDIVIRNNIIYNYNFGIGIDKDSVVGPSARVKVYHNTVITGVTDSNCAFSDVDTTCIDVEFYNNILLDVGIDDGSSIDFLQMRNGDILDGASDYNIMYGSGWNPATVQLFPSETLAAWVSATGNDTHSSIVDPLLVSTNVASTNLAKLQSSSPAIGTGKFVGNLLDYYQAVRSGVTSIGATEEVTTVIVPRSLCKRFAKRK